MNKASETLPSALALARLKEILLSEDQRRIDVLKEELEKLQSRLEDRAQLIETLEPVIAELMEKKIIASRHEMAEALSPIMSEAIKNQVDYAKDEVVDALYPIIGKTIRRSITEAMRNLVRTVNERIERAFSLRRLFLKIKARISGVSEGDLILKESLPFQVHEVFLIHKETGILLSHAAGAASHSGADQELITGMLTAIKDFAQNVFTGSEIRDLYEIQYEDRQIRLEPGQFAYLACVTAGIPPENFTEKMGKLVNRVSRKFLPALRDFEGDAGVFQPAQPLLRDFVHLFDRQEALEAEEGTVQRKRFKFGFLFLFCLLIVFLGIYIGIFLIPKKNIQKSVVQTFTELENKYPSFVKADIQFHVRGRNVFVSGEVPQLEVKEEIEGRLASISSVRRLTSWIEVVPWTVDPERLYEDIRKSLSDTSLDFSQIKFVIEKGILYLTGVAASREEKAKIVATLAEQTSLPVIVDRILLDERSDRRKIKQFVEETVLYFLTGQSELESLQLEKLLEIRDRLRRIDFFQLNIFGHADDTGTDEFNLRLSQKRAEWVKSFLIESGIPENKLTVVARGSDEPAFRDSTMQARALNRRVVFVLRFDKQVPQ